MEFYVLETINDPNILQPNTAYLEIDNWDDYRFSTQFFLYVSDSNKKMIDVGSVKIGFKGQKIKPSPQTKMVLPSQFSHLDSAFFSIGQDVEYYKKVFEMEEGIRADLLSGLRDIAYLKNVSEVESEPVFETSLLRTVSLTSITEQYTRVLKGDAALSNFNFSFELKKTNVQAGYKLDFNVIAESKPSTNIHVVIGRNGVGKTTLFRKMVEAFHVDYITNDALFRCVSRFQEVDLKKDYFGGVVSIAFSAFDPFEPLREQRSKEKGNCYYYVGLKALSEDMAPSKEEAPLKSPSDLSQEFTSALGHCFSQIEKKRRWLKAIEILEFDENFEEMQLGRLAEIGQEQDVKKIALHLMSKMSSGHKIVLLSITRLVQLVEEKTLVLIDEPESHLHPPLLSAFVRALSSLLYSRNGVAIIATHSPVVLQEVPRECVWKLNRLGLEMRCERPNRETFGENVGVLTREVFGLSVSKSGFHSLLQAEVENGGTFDDIVRRFENQLGIEGRAILKSLILDRDNGVI